MFLKNSLTIQHDKCYLQGPLDRRAKLTNLLLHSTSHSSACLATTPITHGSALLVNVLVLLTDSGPSSSSADPSNGCA